MWLVFAFLSAFFAGMTSVLAKCGIQKTDSTVATAIRTVVVLLFSWLMVFVTGLQEGLMRLDTKTAVFLVLSGLSTGASWLCYFRALQLGNINKVAPIDKSSTVLSILFAVVFLQESIAPAGIAGAAMIAAGTLLMIEKQDVAGGGEKGGGWLAYAVGSAVFASLTSILGKVGISGVESTLGTAIRTVVVLIMAWVVVFIKGRQAQLRSLDRREALFIALSGIATGASWLCYYYAIQNGVVSVVVPIDKMSILVTVIFSALFLKEKVSRKAAAGLALMLCGTLIMAVWS